MGWWAYSVKSDLETHARFLNKNKCFARSSVLGEREDQIRWPG